ncbi:glutamine--tRNA ligase/YqeY domain fusion protein [Paenibacillus wulumuqiensis]|uniref:glutamine--tRNA ligase/YqeY domain fusion protein n=1 Tax=Paenibacillus wulumuqiensis TaxID=1567107 RepID=UPI00061973A9|nr:glutamine--tRNA ligase/YqeY domain fusion protein [Paenibacillus wulumuqiensis]
MSTVNENNTHFIHKVIEEDIREQAYHRPIATRFPPEPNGYLHIGSAFAIITNAELARQYKGLFKLRMDDTNPLKESMEYVHSIIDDIKWLGYDPEVHFGSDYGEHYYEAAIRLIRKGKAYVCDLPPDEMARYRGTLTEPGMNSPYRDRSVDENLALLAGMRAGKDAAGSRVLRAKIDMASPNMTLRDPVLYRIIHAPHYRTGEAWCIYPMYDFAHPIEDALEGITHSLCSIEFKEHRPLYEWVLNELDINEPPKQREFGRLNITGAVTSKRYLRELVEGGYVDGWDDPRLPTLQGLRRRGFTSESIRSFFREIGMIRTSSTVDIAMLEHSIRQDLKPHTRSAMVILDPVKVIITNYPADKTEWLTVENNAENEDMGTRELPFTRELWIEREDFMEEPVRGFHRLSPGVEVRLKGAYFIRCEHVVRDVSSGEITELHCTYDPATRSGSGFNARKVKATLHWVSAAHGVKVETHLYDRLLREPDTIPAENADWQNRINPDSLIRLTGSIAEPSLGEAAIGDRFQFIRHGYFVVDSKYSTAKRLVFNRIVSLKDSWKGGKT